MTDSWKQISVLQHSVKLSISCIKLLFFSPQWIFLNCGNIATGSLMLPFTQNKTTWLNRYLPRCLRSTVTRGKRLATSVANNSLSRSSAKPSLKIGQIPLKFTPIRGVTRLDSSRGKKQVCCPHVRTWGPSEANLLPWIKYLWHRWDFSAPLQWFGAPIIIRGPGNCAPFTPRYAPVPSIFYLDFVLQILTLAQTCTVHLI